jgi:hypothetical protein
VAAGNHQGVEQVKLDRFTVHTIEECKGVLRHSWYTEPQTATGEPGVIQINNRCERGCGTTRHMKTDRFGNKLSNWRYTYVEGYKDIKAESMTEWRQRYIASLTRKKRKAS